MIDPLYLLSYYTVDSIGYKGRTCYNIPVVIESRTNTAYVYTASDKPLTWYSCGRRACLPYTLAKRGGLQERSNLLVAAAVATAAV